MKKTGLILALMVFVGITSAMAQNEKSSMPKPNKEEMQAKKVAFITEKLALTTEEAQKFWPIYNEMDAKLKENRKQFKSEKPDQETKLDDMTEAEVQNLIDEGFKMKENDLAIRKEYSQKIIAVIGAKRTAKLYHLETEFKKNQMANKKSSSQGPNAKPPVKEGGK